MSSILIERTLQPTGSFPPPPGVSVILPVYNGEACILSAVRSVLNQTYRNLELIVVNDGSTDGTLEKLQCIRDTRLKMIDKENGGVSEARNIGFARSLGRYIAFIDADDIWFPEKIETELATVQQGEDPVCIVYSWYYAVDDANRLVNFSPPFRDKGRILETILNRESVMLPSTALIHRNIYEAIGGFSKDCYHEDRSFFIRACKDFPAYPTQKRLVIYRQTMGGRCRSILKNFEAACQAEYSIIKALKPVLSKEETDRLTAVQTKSLFYRFLMYNFMREARKLYPNVDQRELMKDKKGLLALLSMKTGINFLFGCRLLVQTVTRHALSPWWRLKSKAVFRRSF